MRNSRAMRVRSLAVTLAATSGFGDSVSVTMATSSMPRPTISGSGTPTGIRSILARTLSWTRSTAASDEVPTTKRAVTITWSSRLWE